MKFRLKTKPAIAMETIAFADIVINLFVFFFITFGLFATFDATHRGTLPIALPKAQHALTEKQKDLLILTVDRKGIIYLGTRKIALENLSQILNQELSLRSEKTVLLQADKTLSLETFVSVLDVVRNTKAKVVSIETEL